MKINQNQNIKTFLLKKQKQLFHSFITLYIYFISLISYKIIYFNKFFTYMYLFMYLGKIYQYICYHYNCYKNIK